MDGSNRNSVQAPPRADQQQPRFSNSPQEAWHRPPHRVIVAPRPVYAAPVIRYQNPSVPTGLQRSPLRQFHSHEQHNRYPGPGSQEQERMDQVDFLQHRMTLGITPRTVTGLAAMLIQVETHAANPHQPVTLSVGHGQTIKHPA